MGRYVRDKVNHIDIPVYGGGNDTNYKGTKAVWDTLTDAEKDQYDTYDFSDDFNGMTIDEVPTEGSTNPVQSGGVYTALASKVNTSDIANNVTTTTSGKVLDARQGKLISDKVSNSSDAYSSSKAYKVGDLCIYNDTLYRCITACSAAAWDVNSSCFTADTLVNIIKAHSRQILASQGNYILESIGDIRILHIIGAGIGVSDNISFVLGAANLPKMSVVASCLAVNVNTPCSIELDPDGRILVVGYNGTAIGYAVQAIAELVWVV